MIRKLAFAFIILGLIIRAFVLKDVLFLDWDEGIYAEVSSEIAENKSLPAEFNGEVWLNKPPLSHIMLSTVMAFSSDKELGARLLMVVFGSLMLYMTYVLSRRTMQHFLSPQLNNLTKNERDFVYLLPVFSIASTTIFVERSTQLNTDIMLGVAWLGYFLMQSSYKWKLFFVTFGTWTKSLLGLYPLGFEILMFRKTHINRQAILRGLGLLVIPLSWHIWSYFQFGQYFVDAHIFDQVIKRVVVPIELHFGGRSFYPLLAWKNFSVILLLILVGYLRIFNDAFHLTRLQFNVGDIFSRARRLIESKDWYPYLILFSAIPFFAFLMVTKSKITWYFATVVPLFALVVPYLYLRSYGRLVQVTLSTIFVIMLIPDVIGGYVSQVLVIFNKGAELNPFETGADMFIQFAGVVPLIVRIALLGAGVYLIFRYRDARRTNQIVIGAIVTFFFLVNFIPQTYALHTQHSYTEPDKLLVAKCVSKIPEESVAFMVNEQERKNRNVLEAANLQTATSFIYGGSPSFVYYADKHVNYYYKPVRFTRDISALNLIVVSQDDLMKPEFTAVRDKVSADFIRKTECFFGEWGVYENKVKGIESENYKIGNP